MAIDLSAQEITAQDVYTGDDTFALAAGKTITIETSPNGDELYSGTVPEGKAWNITIFLKIVETDV